MADEVLDRRDIGRLQRVHLGEHQLVACSPLPALLSSSTMLRLLPYAARRSVTFCSSAVSSCHSICLPSVAMCR